ncbi:MAG: hypothetical protein ACK5NT_11700 [Pyrinomonadaceae bacterium]
MPTQIQQIADSESNKIVLRVKGEMLVEDVRLVSRIAADLISNGTDSVEIDLSDLNFLDSDSATMLRNLDADENIAITGIHYFLQKLVEENERRENNS